MVRKQSKRARGTLPLMDTELYQLALASVSPPEPAPGTPVLGEDEEPLPLMDIDAAEDLDPVDHRHAEIK